MEAPADDPETPAPRGDLELWDGIGRDMMTGGETSMGGETRSHIERGPEADDYVCRFRASVRIGLPAAARGRPNQQGLQ